MDDKKTVLITGAGGNLGRKLWCHLQGRYHLRLLDRQARGQAEIIEADLSIWDESWVQQFAGVDTVVHLAADPSPLRSWDELVGPNIDVLINVFTASVRQKVGRIVYASSNHVMGGYKHDGADDRITVELPVKPGFEFDRGGQCYNSQPYAGTKLFGERLGKCYADSHGLSTIAVRIGVTLSGRNSVEDFPADYDDWFRRMWLSDRDYCQVMEKSIEADPAIRFAVINAMSTNTGMRWDIGQTQALIGYESQDNYVRL